MTEAAPVVEGPEDAGAGSSFHRLTLVVLRRFAFAAATSAADGKRKDMARGALPRRRGRSSLW